MRKSNNDRLFIVGLTVILIAVSFVSCRPKGILRSGQMRRVMVDLHKTDALLQLYGMQYGHVEEKDIYYAQVMEKHGVTQAQFDSSLVWYTAHPMLFDKIYPRVLKQLETEEAAFLEAHEDELALLPVEPSAESTTPSPYTEAQVDSLLWITLHGYESTWNVRPIPFSLIP